MFRKTIGFILAIGCLFLTSCGQITFTASLTTVSTTTTAGTATTTTTTASTGPTVQYSVSFHSNGGTEVADVDVTGGETMVLPAVGQTGYVLDGWYLSPEFSGAEFTNASPVTGNLDLYAKWILEDPLRDGTSYATAFLTDASEVITIGILSENQMVYLEFTALKSGDYEIESFGDFDTYMWLCDSEMLTLDEADSGGTGENFLLSYYLESGETYYVIACMFYAEDLGTYEMLIQSPVEYSFNENGGTDVASISAILLVDFPLTEKEGYYLAGWYENPACTGDAIEFPYWSPEDITLYAKWSTTRFRDGQSYPTAFSMAAAEVKTVDIERNWQNVYFEFSPTTTGNYVIESFGEFDTYLWVIDGEFYMVDDADSGGTGENFLLSCYLESGETYYFVACMYYEDDLGSFTISVNLE
jgi:uncharacterized repeat protein (TIGR02543 family)